MPKTKTDETDSRPAAVASAGTLPGDLAHEIDLLGAVLRLTPEQRAAAQSVGRRCLFEARRRPLTAH